MLVPCGADLALPPVNVGTLGSMLLKLPAQPYTLPLSISGRLDRLSRPD
jgi:hypothetical protein